jgi:Fe2+ transport system protein B
LDEVNVENNINELDIISDEIIEENEKITEDKEEIKDLEEIEEKIEDNFSKTVDSIDNDLCVVENILSEDTMRLIVLDEEEKENAEEHQTDYVNAILWDIIIGLLILIFTILSIIFIWFMVFLITY